MAAGLLANCTTNTPVFRFLAGLALALTPAAEATAFEAFVGALHMEQGSARARQYARDFVVHSLEKVHGMLSVYD